MTSRNESFSEFAELSPELQERIDELCDRFESACRTGAGPRIEDFVNELTEADRQFVLRELLPLEIAYRQRLGEVLTVEDYRLRFPECDADWLRDQLEVVDKEEAIQPPATEKTQIIEPPEVERFRELILESQLLTADEYQTAVAALTTDDQLTSMTLARAFVKRGVLTKFQAQMLLRAKPKGLVLGDYVVLDLLGRGGMGAVYRARHRRMERIVAIKVLPPSLARDRQIVERFRREVKTAARLVHPQIVSAFDAGEQHGILYLVMEFVAGQNLAHWIKTHGPMAVTDAIEVTLQTAAGLAYAHEQGVIHRDIKPHNLMLVETSEGLNVKVLDMGLARFGAEAPTDSNAATGITRSGMIIGTAEYMAPEQAINVKQADHRADIYSLGATLFYLLTGQHLFAGNSFLEIVMAHQMRPAPTLKSFRSDVSQAIEDLFQQLVMKRPEERPQSMLEVIDSLHAIQRDLHRQESPKASQIRLRATAMARTIPVPNDLSTDEFFVPIDDSNDGQLRDSDRRFDSEIIPGSNQASMTSDGAQTPDRMTSASDTFINAAPPNDPERTHVSGALSSTTGIETNASAISDFNDIPSDAPTRHRQRERNRKVDRKRTPRPDTHPFSLKLLRYGSIGVAAVSVLLIVSASINRAFRRDPIVPTVPEVKEAVNEPSRPAPALAVVPFYSRDAQLEWAAYLGIKDWMHDSADIKMMLIPPGEFMMGTSEDEARQLQTSGRHVTVGAFGLAAETPQHRVRITRPFWMGRTEVTVKQFRRFVDAEKYVTDAERTGGWGFVNGQWVQSPKFYWANIGDHAVTEDMPAVSISYNDALAFCAWRSREESATYRLPTEAEWEFACRAGQSGQWLRRDWNSEIDAAAWHRGNSENRIHPVSTRPAHNLFLLFDILGNESEWCLDYFDPNYYRESPTDDPRGPSTGTRRVQRGGNFAFSASQLRITARDAQPENSPTHGAFRIVREIPIKAPK